MGNVHLPRKDYILRARAEQSFLSHSNSSHCKIRISCRIPIRRILQEISRLFLGIRCARGCWEGNSDRVRGLHARRRMMSHLRAFPEGLLAS